MVKIAMNSIKKCEETKKLIIKLEIDTASKPWNKVIGLKKNLNKAVETTISSLPDNILPVAKSYQIALLLTTDRRVQNLNRDFRNIDKVTNILSFPQFERKDILKIAKTNDFFDKELFLGDLAIAYDTTRKEAKKDDKKMLDHVTHLIIHGTLHLFGFDHDNDVRATKMEKLEIKIMKDLGLLDPYTILYKEE